MYRSHAAPLPNSTPYPCSSLTTTPTSSWRSTRTWWYAPVAATDTCEKWLYAFGRGSPQLDTILFSAWKFNRILFYNHDMVRKIHQLTCWRGGDQFKTEILQGTSLYLSVEPASLFSAHFRLHCIDFVCLRRVFSFLYCVLITRRPDWLPYGSSLKGKSRSWSLWD